MNNVSLMGRSVKDPDVRTAGSTKVGRITLAVDRRYKKEGEPSADFISCVAFGKTAEALEKYVRKGTKIALTGRIQTGSYTNKDGNKVYTTDVIMDSWEFAESKNASQAAAPSQPQAQAQPGPVQTDTDFMSIPTGMGEELPFN